MRRHLLARLGQAAITSAAALATLHCGRSDRRPTAPGDGGPATEAALVAPEGIAIDARGNVFVAERAAHRVRRIDARTGVITTYAGTGEAGFGGDGGPAVEARLNTPSDLAVDPAGNLYIADGGNDRIRRVEAGTGTITTVVGSGRNGFSGDGGPAGGASLNFPFGVALGPHGDLYIADTDNQRIRRVDARSGVIRTVAGNGIWDFGGDGGPAVEASLARPHRIAIDSAGDVYIGDAFNHRIRVVDAETGTIRTIAGTGRMGSLGDGGPATWAATTYFGGLALDGTSLVFTDIATHRVRSIDLVSGVIRTIAGSGSWGFAGDGGRALDARFHLPGDIALAPDGDLVLADIWNGRVRRIDRTSGTIATIAGSRPTPPTPDVDFHFHYDLDSLRAAHDAPVALGDPHAADAQVRALRLAVPGRPDSLHVALYTTSGRADAPLVLLLHGRAEDEIPPEQWGGLASWARLLAARGFAAAVVFHRLGSRARSLEPAFRDVRAALDSLRDRAAALGVDPDRVCLLSFSGGSTLIAPFLDSHLTWLRCVAAFSPHTTLEPPALWDWYSEPAGTRHTYAPARRLTAHAPPLFLAVGAGDRPAIVDSLDAFARHARELGVAVELERHPTGGNDFERRLHDAASRRIVEGAVAFLREWSTQP